MSANREPRKPASNGEESGFQEDVVAFERVVPGDCFVNNFCVECGNHGALFVIAGGRYYGRYVGLCPLCVSVRIERYRRETGALPRWVEQLDKEAKGEVQCQAGTEEARLQVDWDDLYKCARCGHIIRAEDARYWSKPGENFSPPYCLTCIETVRGEQ
jgi:hypothetical protein